MTASRALTTTALVAGIALALGSASPVAHAAGTAPPLQVVVDDGRSVATAGSTVTYALSVTSSGDADEDVTASLVLSEHLRVVSASDGGAEGADPGHGWTGISWDGLAVAAGSTRTVTATVRVLDTARFKVTAIGSAVGTAGATTPRPSCAADPQCDLDVTAVDRPAATTTPVAPAVTKPAPAKVTTKTTKKSKKSKNKKTRTRTKKQKAKKAKAAKLKAEKKMKKRRTRR